MYDSILAVFSTSVILIGPTVNAMRSFEFHLMKF
jgi:hypothetical protein